MYLTLTFGIVLCIGESGLGKSTLVNSLFLADLYSDRKIPDAKGNGHHANGTVGVVGNGYRPTTGARNGPELTSQQLLGFYLVPFIHKFETLHYLVFFTYLFNIYFFA